MCGRFTHRLTWERIHALYQLTLEVPPSNLETNFNVCPTDPVSVILAPEGKRAFARMRWGMIPAWWNKTIKEAGFATFNARAETVESKPMFRGAWKERKRCLIPISGYYEWQYRDGPKQPPQPWYFTAADGSPILSAAGLWDEWKDRQTGERLRSCTMIITEPNDFVREVHDRMPVLLEPDQFAAWLDGSAGKQILNPPREDLLQRRPVSKRVNSSRTPGDDPTLIEEVKLAS
jgi:putative SOS response-associated peptidase YedK